MTGPERRIHGAGAPARPVPTLARSALARDILAAARYRQAILLYAWADIRMRFDRTFLGPFWIVVTSLAWVVSVGLVMSELFKQSLARELPYLFFGVLGWSFLSSLMLEAATAYISQRQLILGYRLPLSFFVLRAVVRNFIVLAILTAVALAVAIGLGLFRWTLLLHIGPVFAVLAFVTVPGAFVLSSFGARVLDVGPALTIAINILVIVTPVFWRKSYLPPDHLVVRLNPFVYVLDLYRDLLLLGAPSVESYLMSLLIGSILWIAAVAMFGLTHARIRRWL